MPHTAVYAALLALLFLGLSVRVIRLRQAFQVALGDAGEKSLKRAIRVQANFTEYVPLCLLLLYFVESGQAPAALMHGLGVALLMGRSLHAFGVSHVEENLRFRVAGMAITFGVLLLSALYLLYRYWV